MHLRFDSDEELEDAQPSAAAEMATAAPATLPPPPPQHFPTACAFATAACTARVDFNMNDPTYVFQVSICPDREVVAASASNHHVKTYSLRNTQLTFVGDLKGHQGSITQISHPRKDCPYALYSSSRDGTIRGWDLRTGKEVESYKTPTSRELFCFDACGTMLAAGGQGEVIFFDTRTRAKQGAFTDTHMDDVTQVKLQTDTQHLISASEDGLVAVHTIGGTLDEDEGFQAALNITNSVEEIGFWGPQNNLLWCRSGTHSLHLWEWLKATKEDEQGGDTCFMELQNAREAASKSAGSSSSSAAQSLSEVDYLAGCHFDAPSGRLMLAAGSNNGALGFFPVDTSQSAAPNSTDAAGLIGPPGLVLQGIHSDVVRCWSYLEHPEVGPMFLTGGEDSKIGVWVMNPSAAPHKPPSTSSGSLGVERTAPTLQKSRRAPY